MLHGGASDPLSGIPPGTGLPSLHKHPSLKPALSYFPLKFDGTGMVELYLDSWTGIRHTTLIRT